MKPEHDAYGRAMLDHLEGRETWEIVERDDGYFGLGAGPALYFAEYEQWRPVERGAMEHVRGRVLDLGCGAGRHLLWLHDRGHEVVGIDVSPGAVECCRRRGLAHVYEMPVSRVGPRLGRFDTILMLGGNLGLLGPPERGRRLLSRLHRITAPGARIVGASRDRTKSDDPDVQDLVRKNLEAGRLTGRTRVRFHYRRCSSPWTESFRINPVELEGIVAGTGWEVTSILDGGGDLYVAVMLRSG